MSPTPVRVEVTKARLGEPNARTLSIITVTWNCRQHVQRLLQSLGPLLKDPAVEVIVIDNASSDGTPQMIATEFPEVRFVGSRENLGFAKANNRGLVMAGGEWVCLVNPDVKVLPGCLDTLLDVMGRESAVGIIGPQMLGQDGRPQRSTMRLPSVWNHFCSALALDTVFPEVSIMRSHLTREFRHDKTVEVEVLNGWFWLTRRAALESVGPLDEAFFMYGEDIDWCRRYKDKGWRILYCADAASVHYGGGSSENAPIRFYLEQQRAMLQYFRKHHGGPATVAVTLTLWLYHCVRIAGHTVACVRPGADRREQGFKIKRSVRSIRWLAGV